MKVKSHPKKTIFFTYTLPNIYLKQFFFKEKKLKKIFL